MKTDIRLIARGGSSNYESFHIEDIVTDFSIETQMYGQPGVLNLTMIKDNRVNFREGSAVSVAIDGKLMFYGYVFKGRNGKNTVSLTAYDKLRYLSNTDTYVNESMTASQVFEKICGNVMIDHKVVHPSSYVLPDRVHDLKSYYDIIFWGIEETLIANPKEFYFLRDNAGVVEFADMAKVDIEEVIIAEGHNLYDSLPIEFSIDGETYNEIRLVKEDKQTKKRVWEKAEDIGSINAWGVLAKTETINGDYSEAQIKEMAGKMLRLYNRVSYSVHVYCEGNKEVFAGRPVVIVSKELPAYGLQTNKPYFVRTCRHNFKNNRHTMDLDLEMVFFPEDTR